jgi:hypothetical protein
LLNAYGFFESRFNTSWYAALAARALPTEDMMAPYSGHGCGLLGFLLHILELLLRLRPPPTPPGWKHSPTGIADSLRRASPVFELCQRRFRLIRHQGD